MCKAAAAQIKGTKPVKGGQTALDKARIIGRNPKRRHRRHNLCRALRKAAKAAIGILLIGQIGKRIVDGVGQRVLCLKSCQRAERHSCHIDVRFLAKAPAAVCMLHGENFSCIIPARLSRPRHFRLISCIQGQKRPDSAVKALPHGFFFLSQRLEQVVSIHILCICTGRRQRQRNPCIFRILLIVQNAGALYNILPRVFLILRGKIRVLRAVIAHQPQRRPIAADSADCRIWRVFCQIPLQLRYPVHSLQAVRSRSPDERCLPF